MNRKKAWILIILTLVVAVVVPLSFQLFPTEIRTHTLSLEAKKYGYSPSRIIVNLGDKIVLKPTSLDATNTPGKTRTVNFRPTGTGFLKSNLWLIKPANSLSAAPRPAGTCILL